MIAIISDTHLPRGGRRLRPRALSLLTAAELIIHAGDLSQLEVLDELRELGRVVAVYGNVDAPAVRDALPERLELALGDVRLGIIHDAGPVAGRVARLHRAFPDVDAVIFGHSHIPLLESDPASGFQIFNPGSPTDPRGQPHPTMGLGHLDGGSIRFELIEVDADR